MMLNYNDNVLHIRFNNSPIYTCNMCWERSMHRDCIDTGFLNTLYTARISRPDNNVTIKFVIYSLNNDISANTIYSVWQEILKYTGMPANYEPGTYTCKKDVCRDVILNIIGETSAKLYNAFIASFAINDNNIEFTIQADYYTETFSDTTDAKTELLDYMTEQINAEINKKIIDDVIKPVSAKQYSIDDDMLI